MTSARIAGLVSRLAAATYAPAVVVATMWKRPAALASTGLGLLARCGSLKLFCSAVAVSVALVLSGPSSSLANTRTAKPGTVIACFHEEISRFTAQAHPGRCNIWGYLGKRFVGVPVKGMRWGHWGANPTRAAFGVDMRDGTRVRIIAYRPIPCDEGRTWYSRVVVVFPGDGDGFELRLPTCDGPSIVG